jgi:hypothetical protein
MQRATEAMLKKALNLLADEVSRNVPTGYAVVLRFQDEECLLTLEDPEGDVLEDYGTQAWCFREAMELAQQHEREANE